MSSPANNPFITGTYRGREYGAVTADDRVSMVRRFDRQQCLAALELPSLQKTVRDALDRRLHTLDRKERSRVG